MAHLYIWFDVYLIAVLCMSFSTCQDALCSNDEVYFQGNCYYFSPSRLSWHDSLWQCNAKGMSLVDVQSQEEHLFITSLALNNTSLLIPDLDYQGLRLWLGLTKRPTGKFAWRDGPPLSLGYSNWATNKSDVNGRQPCVEMRLASLGKWYDISCHNRLAYACKRRQVTECPKEWLGIGRDCFLLYDVTTDPFSKLKGVSWFDASEVCRLQGGFLPSSQNFDLMRTLSNVTRISGNTAGLQNSFWVGKAASPQLPPRPLPRPLLDATATGRITNIGGSTGFPDPNNLHKATNPTLLPPLTSSISSTNVNISSDLCSHISGIGPFALQTSLCKKNLGFICQKPKSKKGTSVTTKTGVCNADGKFPDGSCYVQYNKTHLKQGASWHDASKICHLLSGDLISINSSSYQQLFKSSLFEHSLSHLNNDYWIGLSDFKNESEFIWVDHSSLLFQNWQPAVTEPDNEDGKEDCVTLGGDGFWDDENCNENLTFICSRELAGDKCPPGDWFRLNNECFYSGNKKKTWYSARKACRNHSSDLLSISEGFDWPALKLEISANNNNILYDSYWIGLKRNTNNQFGWSNTLPFNYTNWRSIAKQPDALQDNFDCVTTTAPDGYWYDRDCSQQYGFVCKSAPPPNERPILIKSPPLKIALPLQVGQVLAKINATDPEGGKLEYHILYIQLNGKLQSNVNSTDFYDCDKATDSPVCVNPESGVIKLGSSGPSVLTPGVEVRLLVYVRDNGYPSLSNTGPVTLILTDQCSPITGILAEINSTACLDNWIKDELTYSSIENDGSMNFNMGNSSMIYSAYLYDLPIEADVESIELDVIRNGNTSKITSYGSSHFFSSISTGVHLVLQQSSIPHSTVKILFTMVYKNGSLSIVSPTAQQFTLKVFNPRSICGKKKCARLFKLLSDSIGRLTEEKSKLCASTDNILFMKTCTELPLFKRHPIRKFRKFTKISAVNFTCSFTSVAKIIWFKDGKELNVSQLHKGKKNSRSYSTPSPGSESELTFLPNSLTDQGYYQCAVSDDNNKRIYSKKALLFFEDVSTSKTTIYIDNMSYQKGYTRGSTMFNNLQKRLSQKFKKRLTSRFNSSSASLKITRIRKGSLIVDATIYQTGIDNSARLSICSRLVSAMKSVEFGNMSINWQKSNVQTFDCCPPDVTGFPDGKGVYQWPNTPVNVEAQLPCVYPKRFTSGVATRMCKASLDKPPTWSDDKTNECGFKHVTTQMLDDLFNMEIDDANVETASGELRRLTSDSDLMSTVFDVELTSNVMEKISGLNSTTDQVIDDFVDSISNMEDVKKSLVSTSELFRSSSSRMITSMRSLVTKHRFRGLGNAAVFSSVKKNAALAVTYIEKKSKKGLSIVFDSANKVNVNTTLRIKRGKIDNLYSTDASLFLPESIFDAEPVNDTMFQVSTMSYSKGTLFPNLWNATFGNLTLNSVVLSASVADQIVVNLTSPVTAIFKAKLPGTWNTTKCVFWDFGLDGGSGGWSADGCYLYDVQSTHFVCHCNHLTNFAILLDVTDPGTVTTTNKALDIITAVGIGISLFCLLVTFISFLMFRSIRKNLPPQILMSLCVALIGAYTVFIFGIDRTSPVIGCRIASILLHYFVHATFMWMAVEGFNLYRCFVRVVGSYTPKFMLKASIVSWGVPAVVVGISAAVRFENFGSTQNCMVQGNSFYIGFLSPIIVILIFNFVVLFMVLRGLIDRPSLTKDKKLDAKSKVRIALACSTLLGLTWIFGLFTFGSTRVLFQWLFSVLNSLQGLFIFIFYFLMNRDIRREWRRFLGMSSPYDTTSGSGGYKKGTPSSGTTSLPSHMRLNASGDSPELRPLNSSKFQSFQSSPQTALKRDRESDSL